MAADLGSRYRGMDPFIEAAGLWEDFHSHLIEDISRELAATVPERYVVRTGERSYVVLADQEGERRRLFKPDVAVARIDSGVAGATAVAEPAETDALTMRAFIEEAFRETFVEIRRADGERELVTAIEVLSPTNKRKGSPGWDEYMRKRQGLLLGEAHFIEIDLLRGGQRLPMVDPWPNSPYYLLVSRKSVAPTCKVWRGWSLEPLPSIPVPLLAPDPDAVLALQPLIDAIYARFRYRRSIDYTEIPPGLSEAERQVAAAMV